MGVCVKTTSQGAPNGIKGRRYKSFDCRLQQGEKTSTSSIDGWKRPRQTLTCTSGSHLKHLQARRTIPSNSQKVQFCGNYKYALNDLLFLFVTRCRFVLVKILVPLDAVFYLQQPKRTSFIWLLGFIRIFKKSESPNQNRVGVASTKMALTT
eukprot:GHVT01003189.1.p1 GENE.GHVT01003189.1~~GHVT01003189.1.p1  ORF type:complete len:152 (-),score=11.20 GHVT01003189.1:735-1190(-)